MPIYTYHFQSEDNQMYYSVNVDKQQFLTEKPFFDGTQVYRILKNPKWNSQLPDQMTYGYAITCHKAQGSQWPRVLIYEEGFPYDKEEHKRWLYTACTRASEKLVIVR
jgi:ATP-dependent exoDNAse (exonuclease V) alpha subunit